MFELNNDFIAELADDIIYEFIASLPGVKGNTLKLYRIMEDADSDISKLMNEKNEFISNLKKELDNN